jgi:hypothetical protein
MTIEICDLQPRVGFHGERCHAPQLARALKKVRMTAATSKIHCDFRACDIVIMSDDTSEHDKLTALRATNVLTGVQEPVTENSIREWRELVDHALVNPRG